MQERDNLRQGTAPSISKNDTKDAGLKLHRKHLRVSIRGIFVVIFIQHTATAAHALRTVCDDAVTPPVASFPCLFRRQCASSRTMWGFLRVENEHLHIYGDVDSPGSGADDSLRFEQVPAATAVSSASAPSSTAGSVVAVGVPVAANERVVFSSSGGGRSRGSGLDRLPYARMEISSGGIMRATNPVKAWCFTKVRMACAVGRVRVEGEGGRAVRQNLLP